MVCPKTSVRGRCSEIQPYLRASQVLSSKESACQCRGHWRCGFSPWVGKFPRRRTWWPTPSFLPGESLDNGAWQTTVRDVAKSWTGLSMLIQQPCLRNLRLLQSHCQKQRSFVTTSDKILCFSLESEPREGAICVSSLLLLVATASASVSPLAGILLFFGYY